MNTIDSIKALDELAGKIRPVLSMPRYKVLNRGEEAYIRVGTIKKVLDNYMPIINAIANANCRRMELSMGCFCAVTQLANAVQLGQYHGDQLDRVVEEMLFCGIPDGRFLRLVSKEARRKGELFNSRVDQLRDGVELFLKQLDTAKEIYIREEDEE